MRRICPTKRGQRITRALTTPVAAAAGCWIPTNTHTWLAEAIQTLEQRNYRADAHAGRLSLLQLLAANVSPRSMAIQIGWAWIEEQTGKGRSWVAEALAWLHEQGLLVTFENGSTHRYRPAEYALFNQEEANRQPVYILTLPNQPTLATPEPSSTPLPEDAPETSTVDETWTPSQSQTSLRDKPTHARAKQQPFGPGKAAKTTRANLIMGHKQAQKINLGQEIAGAIIALRKLSPQHVASIAKPWLAAGWTLADIRYAIDHTPDGQLHPHTSLPHSPAGWMCHRLHVWLNPQTNQPLPSRSQRSLAAKAAAAKSAQERARAAAQEQVNAAPSLQVQMHAARARQVLAVARQAG